MKRGSLFPGAVVAATGLAMVCGTARAGDASDYYPRRTWDAFAGGHMNTSLLVFRDLNRNGVYDLGDRPMSRVA
ncbi:MAG: hypothetical protein E5W03_06245, partial [Mesorhizobium sp.]